MIYQRETILKNGERCILRNGTEQDGEAVLEVFNITHGETDFLMSYPDECIFTSAQESEFLKEKTESKNEIEIAIRVEKIEIVAETNGKIVGTAGIDAVGGKFKISHRADFGIAILKEYCGLGIGSALTNACIECARAAGFSQLELNVVAENKAAVSLYKKLDFCEYGRNPLGFRSRISGMQELVLMRLELE